MTPAAFARDLPRGRRGEKVVEVWLGRKGWFVTPTSDIKDGSNGGPSLVRRVGGERIILPDFLASKCGASRWVEVKTKTRDIRFGKVNECRQGIENRYFEDYLFVQSETGLPGYLAFFVLTPDPVLRIAPLDALSQHRRVNDSPGVINAYGSPMAFWPIDIFESHEVLDDELRLIAKSLVVAPMTTRIWDKPAPIEPAQQEYFNFQSPKQRFE